MSLYRMQSGKKAALCSEKPRFSALSYSYNGTDCLCREDFVPNDMRFICHHTRWLGFRVSRVLEVMSVAPVEQLQAAADRCHQGEEGTCDFKQVLESAISDDPSQSSDDWKNVCENLLLRARDLLDSNTSNGQELLEFVGWDLPAVLVRYIRVSETCQQLSLTIIKCLATSCPPRDIFTTFMEALHLYTQRGNLDLCLCLLQGISLVLPRIQRRRAEFVKEAVTGLLSVARIAESGDEDVTEDGCRILILEQLVNLCQTLQSMWEAEKLEEQKELLRRILAAYVLALLTMVVRAESTKISESTSQLLQALKFCGLTIPYLLAGDLQTFMTLLSSEECQISFRPEAECGAPLAAALALSDEAQENCKRLHLSEVALLDALIRSKSLFMLVLSRNGSWKFAEKGVQLIHAILASCDGTCIKDDNGLTILPLLQVIREVVVHCPYPSLRKSAYNCLTSILRRAPVDAKFEYVVFLMTSSNQPSMVSLLLTFVKDETANAWPNEQPSDGHESNPFTSGEVLRVVEMILHSKERGPPKLPDDMDAVLGALNLYRFLIIREKSGGTNYTGVRSKDELRQAKSQWLEPLRYSIAAVPQPPVPELSLFIDSLQMVLYRCLELVEEELA